MDKLLQRARSALLSFRVRHARVLVFIALPCASSCLPDFTRLDSSARSIASTLAQNASVPAALSPSLGFGATAPARFAVAMDDLEVIGPFSNWLDAKKDFGAVGNGIVDDTASLQRAISTGNGTANLVLKIPPGNYKITSSLISRGNINLKIIGESPANTTITWAGPRGDAMFIVYGGSPHLSRITWDGQSSAGFGVAHWWNGIAGYPQGASAVHEDEIFKDMSIGIMGGRMGSNFGQMDSEGTIRRVTFLRNTFAGFNTGSYNALDWWVFESHFVDCARGTTNNFTFTDNSTVTFATSGPTISNGAGAMYVYRSLFERSTVADVDLTNTAWFSLHQNVSIGSRRFFHSAGMGNNPAPTIIEGNRVLDTVLADGISSGNSGPLLLIDNQFRSLAGTSAPFVSLTNWEAGRDVFSLGNKYTVNNPVQTVDPVNDRHVTIDDKTVAASEIDSALPVLPATPVWSNRQVFEVASGAGAAAIQNAINSASASGSVNAIVHLPSGQYDLATQLVIPAKTRLQLAGDPGTNLNWRGQAKGNMILLNGPSYATVRDLNFNARDSATAMTLRNADQVGGRIFMENDTQGALNASDLTKTQLHTLANPYIFRVSGGLGTSMLNLSNVTHFVAQATGPLGPFSSSGNSSALISDSWYEGEDSNLYRMDSGTFTFLGGMLAPANHSPITQPIVPPIYLNNFRGKATFIGALMDLRNNPQGVGIQIDGETSETNALFLGFNPGTSTFYNRKAAGGNVGLFLSKMGSPAGPVNAPNQGQYSSDFVTGMLAQARSLEWDTRPYSAPESATDVRIYNVVTFDSMGIRIFGN